MMRYPARFMYSETPFDGRMGLPERPTTAMTRVAVRISFMVAIAIHLQYLPKPLDLFVRESPPAAGGDIELQKTDLHAAKFFDQPAGVFEHFSNLILPALGDLHFVPRIRTRLDHLQLGGRGLATMQRNPRAKFAF